MKSTSPADRKVTSPPFLPSPILPPPGTVAPPPFELELELSLLEPQPATTTASATVTSISGANRLRISLMPILSLCWGAEAPRMSPCRPRRAPIAVSLPAPRVEGVLQAVPDEVEREHREEQREAGEEHEPPGDVEDAGGFRDHRAPRGLGRLHADAEEREGGLEEDVRRDQNRRVDDDRRDEVREDLPEDDAHVGRAERSRRLDELLL